jgi:hypothetical protein
MTILDRTAPSSGGAAGRGQAPTVEAYTAALRALADDGDALVDETRLRIRRSLEAAPMPRRKLAAIAVAFATLFGGTVAWALVTRRAPCEPAAPAIAAAVLRAPVPVVPRPDPASAAPAAPVAVPAAPIARPMPATPAAPPIELLYRRAHALHFHGGDVAAALAAWDAYLAAEPAGRFAVEARYNRALCLIRLGRPADARAALIPFATDQVMPRGYRHDEAAALVERLDAIDGIQ